MLWIKIAIIFNKITNWINILIINYTLGFYNAINWKLILIERKWLIENMKTKNFSIKYYIIFLLLTFSESTHNQNLFIINLNCTRICHIITWQLSRYTQNRPDVFHYIILFDCGICCWTRISAKKYIYVLIFEATDSSSWSCII